MTKVFSKIGKQILNCYLVRFRQIAILKSENDNHGLQQFDDRLLLIWIWIIETKENEKSGLKSNRYKITKSLFAIVGINSIFEGSPVDQLITQPVNWPETLGCPNQSTDEVINHPIGKLKAMLKIHLLRAQFGQKNPRAGGGSDPSHLVR